MLPLQPPAAAQVFHAVLAHGPLSRADVGRRTGLSPGAVTKGCAPLLEEGWIEELGPEQGDRAAGRPATLLAVRAQRAGFIGVKVTAEQLFGVRTDLTARPLAARRADLDSRDVGSVVLAIGALVRRLSTGRAAPDAPPVRGLGVALAGDVDRRTGVVNHSPFLNWRGVPLARLVEQAAGVPAVVENDVRALTVAEQWSGAGAGSASFALITVGAGIGAGLSVGGRVVTGARGVAGEIGHLPVPGADRMCTCGNVGCVESVASTQAIVEQVRRAAGDPRLTMADAVRLARGGDPAVLAVFAGAARALGLAMAAVANLIGPERIIVSGEGVAFYDLYAQRIRETFAAHAFGAAKECDLVVRPLPFEEWARGGAAVAARTLLTPARPARTGRGPDNPRG